MAEIEKIKASLQQVLNHKLFAKSSTYKRLLEYLVEKALISEDINENAIGTDLFGIDYTKDKNNGTVRSYMYMLRKKLTEYYADPKQEHQIVFFLEKGQYNVSFISKNDYNSSIKSSSDNIIVSKRKLKIIGVLVLLLLAFGWLTSELINKPQPIWKPFLSDNTLVVVSDQFILNVTDSLGERRATMYKEINSNKDFIEYSSSSPNKKLSLTDYTLLSKMAPYGIKILTEWFVKNEVDYTLKLESMLTSQDIQNHHILFIGQYKTMDISSSLFLNNSKVFSTFRDGFKYELDNVSKEYDTQFGEGIKVEYAMVSFTSFNAGKRALYFVSNNDIGVIATVRNFTNKKWLNQFVKQLPDDADNFNALFEVSGLQRTEVSCKLVELEVLEN